jgi:beta-galactosidase
VAGGPLELPVVAPGERATVAIPGWVPPPNDGREAFLTVVFATRADEAWAAAGLEVGWGQLEIRPAAPGGEPAGDGGGQPVEIDDEGRLVHPLLARAPELSLWRAPTDNDRIAGIGAQWAELGLDRPERRLIAVERDGPVARVIEDLVLADGSVVRHETSFRRRGGDVIAVRERVVVPAGLDGLARVGMVLETVPGLEDATWYGRGPHESYPDRRRGARVGRWQMAVTDLATPYIRPQENGGRADVRWLELRDPDAASEAGRGLRLAFDRPLQVSATHHRAADLAAATHDNDLVARPETIVHLDVVHRGLGTASCGPDTLPEYLVGPGTYEWGWTIGPAPAPVPGPS